MKLVDDPDVGAWLTEEDLEFEWDEGNQTKSVRKHGVKVEDIEALFVHGFLFEGRIIEPAHSEPRWLLLGVDGHGRKLALIFTIRRNRLRSISCRSMRARERIRYEEAVQRQSN
jgi:uncharacterized protein